MEMRQLWQFQHEKEGQNTFELSVLLLVASSQKVDHMK